MKPPQTKEQKNKRTKEQKNKRTKEHTGLALGHSLPLGVVGEQNKVMLVLELAPWPSVPLEVQQTILTEAANRVRQLANLPSGKKHDKPLFVVVTKQDLWGHRVPAVASRYSIAFS